MGTARIVEGTLERTVSAFGSVTGGDDEEASLSFAVPGRIEHIFVSVGDRVAAGTALARLDRRPFEADVAAARAGVASASANLEKVRTVSRPQTIDATDAQIVQARTQVAVAQSQLARQQRLVDLGIAARTDLETAKTQAAAARAQLAVLQQQRSAQARPWEPDVDAGRAGVDQARAALASAIVRLDGTSLVAPFAGTVVARSHSDGEMVEASTPVVRIASDRPPTFTADFAPGDAREIPDGAPATIVLSGSNAVVRGRVIARNVAQSASHTVPVLVRLATAPAEVGPGAYGTARIVVGRRRGLVVPAASIVADAATGVTQLFRKRGDRFVPVLVDVVARENGRALVVGFGLRAGQIVATDGADELAAPPQTPNKDAE